MGKEIAKELAVMAVTTVLSTIGLKSLLQSDDEEVTASDTSGIPREVAISMIDEMEKELPDASNTTWSADDLNQLSDDEFKENIRACMKMDIESDGKSISSISSLGSRTDPVDFLIEYDENFSTYTKINRVCEDLERGEKDDFISKMHNSAEILGINPEIICVYTGDSIDYSERVKYLSKGRIMIIDEEYIRREFIEAGLSPPSQERKANSFQNESTVVSSGSSN